MENSKYKGITVTTYESKTVRYQIKQEITTVMEPLIESDGEDLDENSLSDDFSPSASQNSLRQFGNKLYIFKYLLAI